MATLKKYYKLGGTSYIATVDLGVILDIQTRLNIGLMSLPIPLMGSRSTINMDINGISEAYSIQGIMTPEDCSVTHTTAALGVADCVTTDWGTIRFLSSPGTNPRTDPATFVTMMKFMSVNQVSNWNSGFTGAAGGLYFNLPQAEVAGTTAYNGSFPQEPTVDASTAVGMAYITDFQAKYIGGSPKYVEYTLELTMGAPLA